MFQTQVAELQLLGKILGYFRTHWWVFVLEAFLIWGTSLHKYKQTPPVYESRTSLLIDSTRRQLYQSVVLPGYGESNGNARKRNIAQLLMSQEVSDRFRTQMTDTFNSEGQPQYLRYLFSADGSTMMGDLRDFINLGWDKNSDAYNITCTAMNPDAAHDLCQALLTTIEGYYPEVGEREAMLKRDFLSRQISILTQQISELEQGLMTFQKKNSDFVSFILSDSDEKGLQRLKTDESRIQHDIATNRAIKRMLLSVPLAKRGEYTTLETSIVNLTQRVADLQYQVELTQQSAYPDRDERVLLLHKEIDRLSTELEMLNDKEEAAYVRTPLPATDLRKKISDLELEYHISLIRLQNTQKEISELNSKESIYAEDRLSFERKQAELAQKKKLLANLLQKQQETELELSTGKAEIFPLEKPTRSGFRVEPQLSRFFFAALSTSLFFFGVTATLLLLLFPRLDSEDEVNKLNLPVLGKLPVIRRYFSGEESISGFGLEYLKIMNYRILRETKEIRCPVVVVTSPHAREGKSTLTQLLALASQSPGRKTLLIDGDLLTSHPNIFYSIKENHSPGLKSVLTDPQINIDPLILPTQHDGISVMPRGGRMEPSPLPNFLDPVKAVLDKLRSQYDLILVDTPPLFAANLAHQWAGLGDLIVLVARMYTTRPRDLKDSIQTCKLFSRSPVGVALNCMPITGPERRASNYYFSRKKSSASKMAA